MAKPSPFPRGAAGLALMEDHSIGVALGEVTAIFNLSPDELRELASQMLAAADAIEAAAAVYVDAAFAKASGRIN